MLKRISTSLLSLALGLALTTSTNAQVEGAAPPSSQNVRVQPCTGLDPVRREFRTIGANSAAVLEETCPNDHAYLSTLTASGLRRPGSQIPLDGTCCPLPPGILTERHHYVATQCPQDSVVTGYRQVPRPDETLVEYHTVPSTVTTKNEFDEWYAQYNRFKYDPKSWINGRTQLLRCTEIDSARFVLAEPTVGRALSWGKHFRAYFDPRSARGQLPVALRYGFGRNGRTGWYGNTCAGYPWGSLLVGKQTKACSGFSFAELRFRTAPETAVLDYSACLWLENPLAEQPNCGWRDDAPN